jgi:FKBP-type peptidyl-prolyl cis-trans isomerase
MNRKWAAIVFMFFIAAASLAQDEPILKTSKEKVSYGIGVDAGKNFQEKKLDLDMEMLIKGLRDGFSGNKLLMSDEEIRTELTNFQKELEQKQAEAEKALAEKNKAEGEAFLAQNKTKEGIVALESGLQYKILKAGEGAKPTEENTVQVHYQGTLIDGTEFDNSIKRGKPLDLPLKGIIPGWKEALMLMPVGSKWQLFIPTELAFGAQGSGPIGPNAILILEVELLAIK